MATYNWLFNTLGLRDWCDAEKTEAPLSLAQLTAQISGDEEAAAGPVMPFPSLDELHKSCDQVGQTRDLTASI
ncbi:MAG: glycine/betaine ABC transporter permease, partial [Pseudomonadota bacterium]